MPGSTTRRGRSQEGAEGGEEGFPTVPSFPSIIFPTHLYKCFPCILALQRHGSTLYGILSLPSYLRLLLLIKLSNHFWMKIYVPLGNRKYFHMINKKCLYIRRPQEIIVWSGHSILPPTGGFKQNPGNLREKMGSVRLQGWGFRGQKAHMLLKSKYCFQNNKFSWWNITAMLARSVLFLTLKE